MNLQLREQNDIPTTNIITCRLKLKTGKRLHLFLYYCHEFCFRIQKFNNQTTEIGVGTRLLVSEDQIYLSALKIKQGASYLLATGQSDSKLENFNIKRGLLKLKLNLNLDELYSEASKILGPDKLPKVSGNLVNQVVIKKEPQSPPHITSQIQLRDLKINQFDIGNIKTVMTYQDCN